MTSPETIAPKIRRDLEKLVTDVRANRPGIRGALVLIDDLHRYEGVFPRILSLIGEYGFGSALAPAPAVITYSPRRDSGSDAPDAAY